MILENLSIRQKLLIILVLPSLLALSFLGREIWHNLQLNFSMRLLQQQTDVMLAASDLMHELQAERGLTFGFHKSQDQSPYTKLLKQRQRTDINFKSFLPKAINLQTKLCSSLRGHLDSSEDTPKTNCSEINIQVSIIQSFLTRLSLLRENLQTDNFDKNQVFRNYTYLNDHIMRLIKLLPTQSESAKIPNYIAAYYHFLLAKEFAGQERALLYRVFADDRIPQQTRLRLVNIISEQKTYYRLFEEYVSNVQPNLSLEILQGRVFNEVKRLRQTALNRPSNFNIVADNWFALASERMTLLKEMENQLANGLKALTWEYRHQAVYEFCILLLFTLLSLAVLMALTRLVAGFINQQLDHLVHAMKRVEESADFSIRSEVLSNDELGRVARYFNSMLENLSTHKDELRHSKYNLNLAMSVIKASRDGIMLTNEQGIIFHTNPAFSTLTGYSADEALGRNASLLRSGKQPLEFYQQMWQDIKDKGYWQGEIWNRRKSSEIYPEWLSITTVRDPETQQKLYAGIFSDITEYKRSEALIENLAYYDPLTRLPNRQLLTDRLQVALSTAQRNDQKLALMFIDVDFFKNINSTLGHNIGDQVLQEVAIRLQSCIQEGDTLARYSGDCFVILQPYMDNLDIPHNLALQIFKAMKESILIDGHELYVTVSLGVSLYPTDDEDALALIKNADNAMRRAKLPGNNSFQVYSAEMNEKSLRHLAMGNQLRIALQKKEFSLVYQPKLNLSSSKVVGVEALLRWHNDKLGFVSPAEFIPLAEGLGLIGDIGLWVLQEACHQCRQWQDEGLPPIQMSVNVSPQQFGHGVLSQYVEEALRAAELAPQLLDLEITESCLIEDTEQVIQTLEHLRQKGVSISMDDFGTGYSSLSYLKRIPLDNLKIDQSFMEGIPGTLDDEQLVSTIILMAHNLNYRVIAEGVETAEQLAFLKQLKCDQIQGYFFSRPLPPEEIQALLSRTNPSLNQKISITDNSQTESDFFK